MSNNIIMYIRRGWLALGMAVCLLPLSGCGGDLYKNYKEIDTLQLVQTMGIDLEGDRVLLTVSTGQSLKDQPSVTISRSGESIIRATEEIQDYASKEELYYAHTRFAVLGEKAAKELLPEFFDCLTRSSRLRMDLSVFIMKDSTAETLLTESGEKSFNATEGLSSIEKDVKHRGIAYPFNGRELISRLAESGSALICAVVPVQIEGSIFVEDGGVFTAVPAGYGIIKDGKLLGYLDIDQSRAANILMNKVGYGAIALELRDGSYVTVYTEKGGSEFSADWGEDGSLKLIKAEVNLSCGLAEVGGSLAEMDEAQDEAQMIQEIASALEEKLTRDCGEVLQTSLDQNSDFLGLKAILRMKYPSEVSALSTGFASGLSAADFSIKVNCQVSRSYEFEHAEALMEGGEAS